MQTIVEFLIRHGTWVVFAWVMLEQGGLPVPAVPVLLAVGALAGEGRTSASVAIASALAGSLISDAFWFFLGRRRGSGVLRWVCKISLEPDSCVRRTEEIYVRQEAKSLLMAKFVPGLGTVAPSLAGVFGMPLWRFLLFDGCGALIWAVCFVGLGYMFAGQLDRLGDYAARLGQSFVVLLVLIAGGWVTWKYVQRRKFLSELRIARITPKELRKKLEAGEEVQILDLRHSLDFEAEPYTVPGAVHVDPDDIEVLPGIAQDRDVILYCT